METIEDQKLIDEYKRKYIDSIKRMLTELERLLELEEPPELPELKDKELLKRTITFYQDARIRLESELEDNDGIRI